MSPDLTGLSKFRADEQEAIQKPKAQVTQKPKGLAQAPTYHGRILTFDQSLSDTGWALLVCDSDGIVIPETGLIHTDPTGLKGWEDYFVRSAKIGVEVERLLINCAPDLVAHETPPYGGRLVKPESSLVAAVAIRDVARFRTCPVVMKHRRHVYSLLAGNPNAPKNEMKDLLVGWKPELAQRKPFNQHVVDAIAVGVTAALEESHG